MCPSCEGEKTIKVDSYVGRVSSDRHTAPSTPQVIDAEIQRLAAYRNREAGGNDPNEAYGWERARESRDRQGSYRELERAMEWLYPLDRDWIAWVHNSGLDVHLSIGAQKREERIIGLISERMPSKIMLPRHLHADLMERKRRRAVALLKDGLDASSVAVAVLLPERIVQAL